MNRVLSFAAPVIISLSSAAACAQDDSAVTTRQLTDQIYLFTTDQGAYTTNTIAFVGEDGVLLVDTQAESDAAALKSVVDALAKGTPRYIINTHRHVEHIGGNAIFGPEPVVIAHDLLPEKLTKGSFVWEEYPPETFPDVTLSDSLTLFFNGEKIRIVALAGSHDDNEIIVHFTQSGVVHLSSVVNGFNFPSVDSDGDALMFAPLVARAIELLPEDVILVSGHGDPGSTSQLPAYHDMMVETARVVKAGLDAGKDLATLQEARVLEPWASYAGSYVSAEEWTELLFNAFEARDEPDDQPAKKDIYGPLFHAWKAGGAEAAIERFFELKKDSADGYEITEMELLIIGDKMLDKHRIPDAIRFLEVNLAQYPDGEYAFYGHYDLARAYQEQADKESAVRHCKKAVEMNPDFARASELLEELKKM